MFSKEQRVIICNTECVSQKTQIPLKGKSGRIKDIIVGSDRSRDVYIVKVNGELLPFASGELKAKTI